MKSMMETAEGDHQETEAAASSLHVMPYSSTSRCSEHDMKGSGSQDNSTGKFPKLLMVERFLNLDHNTNPCFSEERTHYGGIPPPSLKMIKQTSNTQHHDNVDVLGSNKKIAAPSVTANSKQHKFSYKSSLKEMMTTTSSFTATKSSSSSSSSSSSFSKHKARKARSWVGLNWRGGSDDGDHRNKVVTTTAPSSSFMQHSRLVLKRHIDDVLKEDDELQGTEPMNHKREEDSSNNLLLKQHWKRRKSEKQHCEKRRHASFCFNSRFSTTMPNIVLSRHQKQQPASSLVLLGDQRRGNGINNASTTDFLATQLAKMAASASRASSSSSIVAENARQRSSSASSRQPQIMDSPIVAAYPSLLQRQPSLSNRNIFASSIMEMKELIETQGVPSS